MKKLISYPILIIISLCIFFMGYNYKVSADPNIYYQVYLNGKSLGIIQSKTELEKYIDKKNNEFKKKFGVKTIYAPNGLEIKKLETYK